jgi:hypothetical protein
MRPTTVVPTFLVLTAMACRPQPSLPPGSDGKTAPTATADLSRRSTTDVPRDSRAATVPVPGTSVTGGENLQVLPDPTVIPAMLIRTGQASIEIDSLEVAVARIQQMAGRLGGYIANVSLQAGRERFRSATLELKVPANRFQEAVAGLQPIGRVESVNVTAEDVGEEFTDVAARVANLHRLEQRLIELLATRTGKLQDVLTVEQELARVRGEIERYEGRMRYLRGHAAVSTLAISVHERAPLLDQPGANPLAMAVRQSWQNFLAFTAGLIAALGTIVPAGALLTGGILAFRRLWRRPEVRPSGA